MPDEVDVESPSEKRELGEHDERHCRCYKPKGSLPPLTPVDDIEKPSLQKSTYYSRVTNKVGLCWYFFCEFWVTVCYL